MRIRPWLAVLVTLGLLCPAGAMSAGRRKGAPARSPAAAAAGGFRHPSAAPHGVSHASASARTLEDIHIEGEIPVPQVLFITARDQRRFMEFQDRRYLRTSRKLGEDTVLPTWIVITSTRPTQNKETAR